MKKLSLLFVLCLILCMVTVNAHELQTNFIEAPCDIVASGYSNYHTATLFGGDDKEQVYEQLQARILDAVKDMRTQIDIGDLNIQISEINDVLYTYVNVLRNNPYYEFFVDLTSSFQYIAKGNIIEGFVINYKDYEKKDVKKIQSDIDKATAQILNTIDDDMTDFEKVMTVHDFMVLNYEYDAIIYENSQAPVVRDVTMMLSKKGVCMGYAYAFKHVMNELGIECGYVVSDAMNHEWNVVKVDGEWYHIDVTQDDPLYGRKYDMFAIAHHEKALLSSQAISSLGAYGYVLPLGVEANSKKYDDAPWRANTGAIVTLNGVTYYVYMNNLVDETGKVIYRNLAKNYGRWNGLSAQNEVLLFTGLASYYGKLYFNTENAIYSYDPASGKNSKLLDVPGVCGMYINGDKLYYGKVEFEERVPVRFSKYGQEDISYMRVDKVLMDDICSIIVTCNLDNITEKQKTAANLYTEDEIDGIVKINIKDIIKMAQVIATKKSKS